MRTYTSKYNFNSSESLPQLRQCMTMYCQHSLASRLNQSPNKSFSISAFLSTLDIVQSSISDEGKIDSNAIVPVNK